MGNLVNGTLKAFKESFDKAQKIKEFQVAARDCTQSFLHKFNKGCEGMFLMVLLSFTWKMVIHWLLELCSHSEECYSTFALHSGSA